MKSSDNTAHYKNDLRAGAPYFWTICALEHHIFLWITTQLRSGAPYFWLSGSQVVHREQSPFGTGVGLFHLAGEVDGGMESVQDIHDLVTRAALDFLLIRHESIPLHQFVQGFLDLAG